MDDLTTNIIVTPFGETKYVQAGIDVTPKRSALRTRLLQKVADESELDLNPEHCASKPYKLKRRLYGR